MMDPRLRESISLLSRLQGRIQNSRNLGPTRQPNLEVGQPNLSLFADRIESSNPLHDCAAQCAAARVSPRSSPNRRTGCFSSEKDYFDLDLYLVSATHDEFKMSKLYSH